MNWWEKLENTDSGFSQGLFRPAKRIKLDPDCLITSVALINDSDSGTVGNSIFGLSSIFDKPCGQANIIKDDFVSSNSIFDLAAKSKYETLLKENFPPTRKYPKKRFDSSSLNDSQICGRKADYSILESSFNNLFDLSTKNYSKSKMGNIFGKEPTPKTPFEQNLEDIRGYTNALTPNHNRLVNYDDSIVSIGQEATEDLKIDTSFLDDKKVPRKSPKKTLEIQPTPFSDDSLNRGLDNGRLFEIQLKRFEDERRLKLKNEEREKDISETEKRVRQIENKRLKDNVAAAERDRLSIHLEGLILDVPRTKPESFPPLPEEAIELVRRAWNKQLPDDEVFADNGIVKIHRKDLLTLSGLDWLNDEIINFYLDLICKRSNSDSDLPKTYTFQTFFYTTLCQRGYGGVKRWTKKVDVFSYDIWLVPVHLQVHWCMAVVDLQNKTIEYYDSMLGKNPVVFELLTEYISSESMDKKKQQLKTTDWKLIRKCDIPTQQNGSDCGMFSCKFGEYASRRAAIDFSQKNMPYFRQRMVYEICQQKLM